MHELPAINERDRLLLSVRQAFRREAKLREQVTLLERELAAAQEQIERLKGKLQ